MSEGLATIMLGIGGLWAVIGVANIVSVASNNPPLLAFATIFNFVLFLLPGLLVVGMGAMLMRKAK